MRVALRSGDYEAALRHAQRAVALARVNLTNQSEVASHLGNLANVLQRLGRYEEAVAAHAEVHAIFREAHGPDDERVAWSLSNLSALNLELDRPEQAYAQALEALRVLENKHGDGHAMVAMACAAVGRALGGMGRHAEAIAHHERALAIHEARLPAGHPAIAGDLLDLSRAHASAGETKRARIYAERALALRGSGRGGAGLAGRGPLRARPGDVAGPSRVAAGRGSDRRVRSGGAGWPRRGRRSTGVARGPHASALAGNAGDEPGVVEAADHRVDVVEDLGLEGGLETNRGERIATQQTRLPQGVHADAQSIDPLAAGVGVGGSRRRSRCAGGPRRCS